MVRGRDACWEHCVLVDATRQKVRCNYCKREFSGGVYRMKFHLAQIKNKDIAPCALVPSLVRDRLHALLTSPKTPKKPRLDHHDTSSTSAGNRHSSTCPPLLFSPPLLHSDDAENLKHDHADKGIAVFLFHNSIPFSVAKSMYYREMVDAIADCGPGYEAPSFEKLKSTLLEKVRGDLSEWCERFRDEWKETGCTILCDGWSDGRTKSFLVFSVTCPKGTLFLKSVDLSGHEDDATYLFELLDSVILDVGVENVVQVITDSGASNVYAGRLVMAKYSSLFCSPCASSCIDEMLEDISKQEWVGTVLEEAKIITRYMYSQPWILNMMRKFTGGRELLRRRIRGFVAHFLSLRSIVIHEDNLKRMFSHSDWLSSIYSQRPDGEAVKSLLYLERFWTSAREAVSVSEPLVRLLRIVDGDMPAMGYMYDGIERAKITIKAHYKGVEEKYIPIWDIIDQRWSVQLHSSLHTAAAFLNPSIFYNPNFKIDLRLRNGFQEAMMKMAVTDRDKREITKEHPTYINAHGALGTEFAIMGRTLNSPGDWWAAYGYEIPTLQRVAIRILSQPCSSHWCRWNWGTFKRIHNTKHRKMEAEKFKEMVFVHCNLWLRGISQSRAKICRAVVFEEVDVSREWATEMETCEAVLHDSCLDDEPSECNNSP